MIAEQGKTRLGPMMAREVAAPAAAPAVVSVVSVTRERVHQAELWVTVAEDSVTAMEAAAAAHNLATSAAEA